MVLYWNNVIYFCQYVFFISIKTGINVIRIMTILDNKILNTIAELKNILISKNAVSYTEIKVIIVNHFILLILKSKYTLN